MNKIWVDIKMSPAAQALIEKEAEMIVPGSGGPGADRLSRIEEADGVVVGAQIRWNAEVFKRARKLKVVARSGIGYDNVDVPDATEHGVCVTNAPDAPTLATAEFTIGAMFALARKIPLADRRYRKEGWISATEFMGFDLAGKTLGLVGLGRIGSRVAEIALALRMRVVAFDPLVTTDAMWTRGLESAADLDALLKTSDIVSIHAPLMPSTRGLIGARALATMKRGALLINAARGGLIDPPAVLAALKNGQLGGAALDVWEPEPMPPDNPFLALDNVIATPHIAAATNEGWSRNNVGGVVCALKVLRGERPASLVNGEVWDRRRK